LREQARNWLRANLELWRKRAESDKASDRQQVLMEMARWQSHTELTGVRDKEELEALPEAERGEWQRFWTEVDDLRRQCEPKE
jgi:hypothetical protein